MSSLGIYTENDIVVIAKTEQFHHPESNLIDYYKLFFQSYYGQGHFISNETEVQHYLDKELLEMKSVYNPVIQDISNQNGMYRVSLDAIKKGILTSEYFLSLFLRKDYIQTDWHQWSGIWNNISKLLFDLYPLLQCATLIQKCVKVIDNNAIISHSECFRLTYSPHYRVMQLSEYDLQKNAELRKYL